MTKKQAERAPGLIVVADALWREASPAPLHVLAAEVARRHPVIWIEAPLWETWRAAGAGQRLRRALRLDLPAIRYVDAQRELDVATPPLWPPGDAVGDALLAQTVTWLLRARKASPRVLWVARRDAGAAALAQRLRPDVTVDFHDDPAPGDRWLSLADMVLWPAWAPVPEGERKDEPRLVRAPDLGLRTALRLVPLVESWLQPTIRVNVGDLAAKLRHS